MATNVSKFRSSKALRNIAYHQMNELRVAADDLSTMENKTRFDIMYEHVDRIKGDFQKHHINVISLGANLDDVDLEAEESIRTQFEFAATFVTGAFKAFIKTDLTFTPLANSSMSMNPNVPQNIRLPRVEIPKFSGDRTHFQSFIELFTELVDRNTSYSEIEKFSYLMTSLEGPPLELLRVYSMTAANYHTAYQALINRYDKKRLIASAHLSALEKAPYLNAENKNAKTLNLLIDTFAKNVLSLQNMGFPTDNWDYLLFYMLSKHLDDDYISKFEMEIAVNNQTIPTLRELTYFLAKQASGMDAVEFNKVNSKGKSVLKNTQGRVAKNAPTCSFLVTNKDNVPNNNCLYCKGNHLIYTCSEFHNIPPKERYNFVKTNSFCVNCISNKHNFYNCRSKGVCRHCKRRHHSLLHFSSSPTITETSNTQANPSNITNNKNEATAGTSTSSNASQFCGLSESQVINENSKSITVLLATANVDILNNVNKTLRVKALLDCGSQTSYITQSLFNKLGIDHFHNNVLIQGLSDMNIQSSCGSTFFKIKTIHAKTPITVEAVILKKLCPIMPSTNLPKKKDLSYLQNISLADETFNEPHHIDIILGADIYPEIILDGRIQGKSSEPCAINTIFGWVLMGKFETDNKNKSAISLLSFANSDNDLINETLKRFWEIEGLPAISNLSPAENLCETKFVNSVVRNDTGRYQVDLPFKDKEPCFDFNKARAMALRRFTQLENRLNKNDDLKGKYDKTIKEYLTSGYLEEIPINEHFQESYYIPHHYVEHGNKFRIVYDASAKVFDGNSLNDHLLIGAKLQTDICFILLNFRFHKYVFTCDIKCMFPQLLINPAHRNFLRILYRFKKEENIKDYRMTRVTFGLACSPFLANRVIKQLAKDEESRFPISSKILQNNLYVDDCCCGANSISASLIMRDELISILQSAGFELRKWSSNDARLLQNLNPDHILYNPLSFDTNSDILKILGLCWDPSNDSFRFRIKNNARACTKRNILSDIARIYDPMGYLTPSTVFIKQILESLWVAAVDWDEEPAEPIRVKWFKFKEE